MLTNYLNFTYHVDNLCKKASNQIRVLKRLSYNLDQGSRMQIFRSFILSHFKYCSIVYHFCGKGNTDKMEKILYRALKFVYNEFDVSYESLLEKANVCISLFIMNLMSLMKVC